MSGTFLWATRFRVVLSNPHSPPLLMKKKVPGTCEKIKKVGNLHSLSIWALVHGRHEHQQWGYSTAFGRSE